MLAQVAGRGRASGAGPAFAQCVGVFSPPAGAKGAS